MTLEQVNAELAAIDSQMKPLLEKAYGLRAQQRRLQSLAFIQANNVRREDVELSSGDGKPFLGHIHAFGDWLQSNSKKRFCEWNGCILFTSEVMAGHLIYGPAYMDDLQAPPQDEGSGA